MAINNKHGFAIDQVIAEELACNNKTSTNVFELNDAGSDSVHIVVEADTAINLAGGKYLKITPLGGASYDKSLPDINVKQGVHENANFAIGDIIAQFALPKSIIGDYRKFKINVNSDHASASSVKVNIYSIIR